MLEEEFITGYQWSPEDFKFIGEYKFPNNKDKEEIHLPPFTTLIKPPEVDKESCAYWDSEKWIVSIDSSKITAHPTIDNYELLRPDYIEHLKSNNLWTDEDENQYLLAMTEREENIRLEKEREESIDYWSMFRAVRNSLLQQSDWTQLNDTQNTLTNEEKENWDSYRQQLRNLPENITDPKPLCLDRNHPQWPLGREHTMLTN